MKIFKSGSDEKRYWTVYFTIILITVLIFFWLFSNVQRNLFDEFRSNIQSNVTFLGDHAKLEIIEENWAAVADLIKGWGALQEEKIYRISLLSPSGSIYAEYNTTGIQNKYEIFRSNIKNGNKLLAILEIKTNTEMVNRKIKEYFFYFGFSLFTFLIFLGYIINLNMKRRRKTIELLSMNNEMRRFNTAFEQSPSSILITDLNGNIEYVNPHFSHLTGYSVNETIGKNPKILKSGKVAPHVYAEMWNTITDGEIWRGELLNRKKNGELYWEDAVIGPVKDEKGKPINYIAVKLDITEYKKALSELEKHKENLELLVSERTKELEEKNQKLTEINKSFIGREMKIKELNLKLKSIKDE